MLGTTNTYRKQEGENQRLCRTLCYYHKAGAAGALPPQKPGLASRRHCCECNCKSHGSGVELLVVHMVIGWALQELHRSVGAQGQVAMR